MTTLNLSAIKTAQPGDVLRDSSITGLQLRATAAKKSFFLYYRTRAKVERRPKIGDWPTVSLEEARTIARGWLVAVAAGKDPVQGWQDEAAAPTVGHLCDKFLAWTGCTPDDLRRVSYTEAEIEKHIAAQLTTEPRDPPLSYRARTDYAKIVKPIIRPKWGAKVIAAVKTADAEALHKSLKATPTQANRVRITISKMFNLAEKWELRPLHTNPATRVQPYPETKRKRYTKPDEARAIFLLLIKYGETYPHQAAFIWLLIYTGARPSEIASARSDQRTGNRFELDKHKTKRHGHDRTIFLPSQAVAVLDRIGRTSNGTITGIKSPRHLWRKILDEAGLKGADLRMYDLRHTFASAGLSDGMSLPEIGGLLGHASPASTQRYAHLMDHVGINRAQRAADALDAMVAGDDDPLS